MEGIVKGTPQTPEESASLAGAAPYGFHHRTPTAGVTPAVAKRIAQRLCDHGWVDDERHYDGDMMADLAAAIQRAANQA